MSDVELTMSEPIAFAHSSWYISIKQTNMASLPNRLILIPATKKKIVKNSKSLRHNDIAQKLKIIILCIIKVKCIILIILRARIDTHTYKLYFVFISISVFMQSKIARSFIKLNIYLEKQICFVNFIADVVDQIRAKSLNCKRIQIAKHSFVLFLNLAINTMPKSVRINLFVLRNFQ